MNVLFLSLEVFGSINDHNLYTDLLREFVKKGNNVYSITPLERRTKEKIEVIKEGKSTILKLRVGNMQKTNLIEKGISTITIESLYKNGIKKFFSKVKFDLILYATPPITFCNVIAYVKRRDHAKTYLMLKDIFPQNAIDLGMLSKTGVKSFLYRYFRKKENTLYAISDFIGCMSPANVQYLLKQNPEIPIDQVGLCPNCIEIADKSIDEKTRTDIRKKYGIPIDKIVLVYGGNLGKPQGIDFLIECLKISKELDVYYIITGSGTEYYKLENYIRQETPDYVKLMPQLSKEDFDSMVSCCDMGIICLDHRFTIPNFPSRLLSYMQAKLPVIAMTDQNTDIGKIILSGKFGWWCESTDVKMFCNIVEKAKNSDIAEAGINAWEYLKTNYDVKKQYDTILSHLNVVDKIKN